MEQEIHIFRPTVWAHLIAVKNGRLGVSYNIF